ncbi:MAG: hypothetical protein WC779_04355 [Candidatus Omnitrophota bacterium]|jgi:hypothetical protein
MKTIISVFCITFALFLSPAICTSVCHAGAAEFENGNPEAWNQWNLSIQDYMDRIRLVQEQARLTAESANKGLDDAAKKADKKLHDQIITETDVRLSVIIKELSSMRPPRGLKAFHDAITETYTNRKLSGEAALKNDYKTSAKYGDMALRAQIRAMEELRTVSLANGAPRYVLDEMDTAISEYKRYLSVKDKTGPA